MIIDLQDLTGHIHPLTYGDHHNFRKKDIRHINETFDALPSPKLIITTEKDATRLKDAKGFSDAVRKNLFVLPVSIGFMQEGEEAFNNRVVSFIKNSNK